MKSLYRLMLYYIESVVLNFVLNNSKLKKEYNNVIIKIDGIGDFIIAFNFLNNLKSDSESTLIITSGVVSELSREYFDFDVFVVDPKNFSRNLSYRFFVKKILYSITTSVVIVPIVSRVFSTIDVIADAIDSKCKYAIAGSFSNINKLEASVSNNFYTSLYFAQETDRHETIILKDFLKFISIDGHVALSNPIPKSDSSKNKNKLINFERYVVISPGSSDFRKNWHPENYKQIVKFLVSKNINIVFLGGENEKSLCQEISSGIPDGMLYNACGETNLIQSFELISNAEILIGNDSSMIHAAVALGVNCLCIAGGGHWGRFVPYPTEDNFNHLRVLTTKMDCFGCNWHCVKRTNENEIYPCISNVPVPSVIQELLEFNKI